LFIITDDCRYQGLQVIAGLPCLPCLPVCRAGLPGKTAGQYWRASLPGKSAGQVCRASLPGKPAGHVRSKFVMAWLFTEKIHTDFKSVHFSRTFFFEKFTINSINAIKTKKKITSLVFISEYLLLIDNLETNLKF
jgi:hypothetical protein